MNPKLAELCQLVLSMPNRVNEIRYPGGKENYVSAMNRACELAEEMGRGENVPCAAEHVYPVAIELRRVINDLEDAHRKLVAMCAK